MVSAGEARANGSPPVNAENLIAGLDRFATTLAPLVQGINSDDARWRPANGAWSILEVVTHLADEEVEDFRRRLQMTLSDPTTPWPPNDPEAWAVERRYNDGELAESLARFLEERRASLGWLRSLDKADWSIAYQHPKVGPVPAGDLLASWAAHDLLHLRQVTKRLFQMAQRDAGEYKTDYAGEWGRN